MYVTPSPVTRWMDFGGLGLGRMWTKPSEADWAEGQDFSADSAVEHADTSSILLSWEYLVEMMLVMTEQAECKASGEGGESLRISGGCVGAQHDNNNNKQEWKKLLRMLEELVSGHFETWSKLLEKIDVGLAMSEWIGTFVGGQKKESNTIKKNRKQPSPCNEGFTQVIAVPVGNGNSGEDRRKRGRRKEVEEEIS